jgi:hypothetical protein
VAKLRDDSGNFRGVERARRDIRLHAVERPRLARGRDRRRRDRQRAIGLQRRVRNPPDMPELEKNPPAGFMHRIGDELPAGDLFGAVDARRAGIAEPLRGHLAGLCDDQTGAGALRVISGVEFSRRVARSGAIARHRRHHDAVRQIKRAETVRRENVGSGHRRAALD